MVILMDEQKQEKFEKKLAKHEVDEDVYSEEGREELLEDDEITVVEEGFMKGEEEANKPNKDKKDEISD